MYASGNNQPHNSSRDSDDEDEEAYMQRIREHQQNRSTVAATNLVSNSNNSSGVEDPPQSSSPVESNRADVQASSTIAKPEVLPPSLIGSKSFRDVEQFDNEEVAISELSCTCTSSISDFGCDASHLIEQFDLEEFVRAASETPVPSRRASILEITTSQETDSDNEEEEAYLQKIREHHQKRSPAGATKLEIDSKISDDVDNPLSPLSIIEFEKTTDPGNLPPPLNHEEVASSESTRAYTFNNSDSECENEDDDVNQLVERLKQDCGIKEFTEAAPSSSASMLEISTSEESDSDDEDEEAYLQRIREHHKNRSPAAATNLVNNSNNSSGVENETAHPGILQPPLIGVNSLQNSQQLCLEQETSNISDHEFLKFGRDCRMKKSVEASSELKEILLGSSTSESILKVSISQTNESDDKDEEAYMLRIRELHLNRSPAAATNLGSDSKASSAVNDPPLGANSLQNAHKFGHKLVATSSSTSESDNKVLRAPSTNTTTLKTSSLQKSASTIPSIAKPASQSVNPSQSTPSTSKNPPPQVPNDDEGMKRSLYEPAGCLKTSKEETSSSLSKSSIPTTSSSSSQVNNPKHCRVEIIDEELKEKFVCSLTQKSSNKTRGMTAWDVENHCLKFLNLSLEIIFQKITGKPKMIGNTYEEKINNILMVLSKQNFFQRGDNRFYPIHKKNNVIGTYETRNSTEATHRENVVRNRESSGPFHENRHAQQVREENRASTSNVPNRQNSHEETEEEKRARLEEEERLTAEFLAGLDESHFRHDEAAHISIAVDKLKLGGYDDPAIKEKEIEKILDANERYRTKYGNGMQGFGSSNPNQPSTSRETQRRFDDDDNLLRTSSHHNPGHANSQNSEYGYIESRPVPQGFGAPDSNSRPPLSNGQYNSHYENKFEQKRSQRNMGMEGPNPGGNNSTAWVQMTREQYEKWMYEQETRNGHNQQSQSGYYQNGHDQQSQSGYYQNGHDQQSQSGYYQNGHGQQSQSEYSYDGNNQQNQIGYNQHSQSGYYQPGSWNHHPRQ